jgi:hypothetical protein
MLHHYMLDCRVYGVDWWIAYGQGFCLGMTCGVIAAILMLRKAKEEKAEK